MNLHTIHPLSVGDPNVQSSYYAMNPQIGAILLVLHIMHPKYQFLGPRMAKIRSISIKHAYICYHVKPTAPPSQLLPLLLPPNPSPYQPTPCQKMSIRRNTRFTLWSLRWLKRKRKHINWKSVGPGRVYHPYNMEERKSIVGTARSYGASVLQNCRASNPAIILMEHYLAIVTHNQINITK